MDFRAIASIDELQSLADYLLRSDSPYISLDTETGYRGDVRGYGSLRVYDPDHLMVSIGITNSEDFARYIPINHEFDANLPLGKVIDTLRPVMDEKVTLYHNALFDIRVIHEACRKANVEPPRLDNFEDTMLMSYVLGKTELHNLKYLTSHYFDYEQATLKSLFPDEGSWTAKDAKRLRFNHLPLTPDVVSYVLDDARFVIKLYKMFSAELDDPENSRRKFIYHMEKEILLILKDMQDTGVAFDWDTFDRDAGKGKIFDEPMENEVKQRFLQELGRDKFDAPLNFNSAIQMRKLLYEDLHLTTTRMTDKGAFSTDQTALQGLATQSPGAAKLAEYKKYRKNLDFYRTWESYKDSQDRRIHANLSQIMIQAGRFASKDPNIQNLKKSFWFQVSDQPKEDVLAAGYNGDDYWTGSHRGYIVASPGYTLLSYDVSQGELRVLSGLSGEPYLKKAFDTGLDIHKATASQMFKVAYDDVTHELRSRGKALAAWEVVLTPNGWSQIGDLSVGDSVMSPDGTETQVVGAYPQGVRPLYEIEFDDGSVVVADDEHLWSVKSKKGCNPKLLTTAQIMSSKTKYAVDLVDPIDFVEGSLPIHPYLLGALLGDGALTSPGLAISQKESDAAWLLPKLYNLLEGDGFEDLNFVRIGKNDYAIRAGRQAAYANGLDRELKKLRLRGSKTLFDGRFGVTGRERFIPEEYLYASISQRLELLRGLMDTDGTVNKDGTGYPTFTSVSLKLAEGVMFLARSLGGFAKMYTRYNAHGPFYNVVLDLKLNPFNMPRKAKLHKYKGRTSKWFKSFTRVDPGEAVCIKVAHPDHEFITAGVTRTHNTLNFGLVYGMGAKLLGETLNVEPEEAARLLEQYFSAFEKVRGFVEDQHRKAHTLGFQETFMGRRITLWDMKKAQKVKDNLGYISKAERLALNSSVQGGLADIMKVGMIRASRILKRHGWWQDKVRLLMNQHDSLVFEVHNSLPLEKVYDILLPAVEYNPSGMYQMYDKYKRLREVELRFPDFITDWEVGSTWGKMEEFKR